MLSAVVLTKNEEKHVVDCLESISFCDEIIVVDDYSEDRTVDIVEGIENKNIKVYKRKLANDFSAQRNFGLSKAKGDWVLFVDVDERVTTSLREEISEACLLLSQNVAQSISNPVNQYVGFYIKRRDFMWGRLLRYGEAGNIKLLRLAKRNTGTWMGKVHEVWKIQGSVGELTNALVHYPHPTITDFLSEINKYTTVRADELYEKGIRAHWWSVIVYPKAKFFTNYILKLGFLDGIPGLLVAILMSFHSFLVRSKLWLLWRR